MNLKIIKLCGLVSSWLYKIRQRNPKQYHRNLGNIEFVAFAAFKNDGGRDME